MIDEITMLRATESQMQVASEAVDRICREMLDTYACTFVLSNDVPYQQWAPLPWGWQAGIENPVTLRRGLPPLTLRGPVAVSVATLQWIYGQTGR